MDATPAAGTTMQQPGVFEGVERNRSHWHGSLAGQSWGRVFVALVIGTVFSACGLGRAEPDVVNPTDTDAAVATSQMVPGESGPSATEAGESPLPSGSEARADDGPPVTVEQAQGFRPNELGQVPILMYHLIGPVPGRFVRTPEQLRADLQWLYDNEFHVISLADYLTNRIDIPAGKRPVVLTFDDSSASQFRLLPIADGRLAIDPNSAVGILEAFFIKHPDFGRGGHFGVNARNFFDWAPDSDESDQTPYAGLKLEWLVENGYEIGNHTVEHANLSELDDNDIRWQLAENDIAIANMVPGIETTVITLPYGMYPPGGDDRLLRRFKYDGRTFSWDAALLVGANPAASPLSTAFAPYETPRIQTFDDELNKWFQIFIDAPQLLYVSDGDPETVTVPMELHPLIAGTLDESKVGARNLVRY